MGTALEPACICCAHWRGLQFAAVWALGWEVSAYVFCLGLVAAGFLVSHVGRSAKAHDGRRRFRVTRRGLLLEGLLEGCPKLDATL